jgi:hypothetical protein
MPGHHRARKWQLPKFRCIEGFVVETFSEDDQVFDQRNLTPTRTWNKRRLRWRIAFLLQNPELLGFNPAFCFAREPLIGVTRSRNTSSCTLPYTAVSRQGFLSSVHAFTCLCVWTIKMVLIDDMSLLYPGESLAERQRETGRDANCSSGPKQGNEIVSRLASGRSL